MNPRADNQAKSDEQTQASLKRPAAVRVFYGGLGLLALGLGILGAFLPLLPTTPFLLVAAFGFARSSDTLHRWLMNHKRFGPMIRNWQEHGAISRRTKIISLSVMALMPPLSWWMGAPWYAVAVQVPVLMASATFIATRPSGPKAAADEG